MSNHSEGANQGGLFFVQKRREMKYLKKALSPPELVELTKARGLSFGSEATAVQFLERISFYRLKGYLLHFERKIRDNTTHQVPPGTTFERVIELYELDRRLRLLFFEAHERIEISFRSAISNTYSLKYGPHWWLDPLHFDNGYHNRLVARIKKDTGIECENEGREREIYIDHYLGRYTEPPLPPTWMLCECISLGVWSMLYKNLVNREARQAVAKLFQVPHTVLESWIHALSVNRNTCAHHARLWNRVFPIKPASLPGFEWHFCSPGGTYAQAFMASYLLRRIFPQTKWHLRIKETLLSCPQEERSYLGAPLKWFEDEFWSEQPLPDFAPKSLQRRQ